MSVQRSPIVSAFETQEQADSHDRWFRSKVKKPWSMRAQRLPMIR